jgi:ssDNA-specific exonuclease RecJ
MNQAKKRTKHTTHNNITHSKAANINKANKQKQQKTTTMMMPASTDQIENQYNHKRSHTILMRLHFVVIFECQFVV